VNIAVVGTGLIGGSVGLAARHRLGARVRGVGPEAERAVARGAADEAVALPDALRDADAVFVAVPVGDLAETVAAALAGAPAGCVVTDVGSTKRAVVAGCDDQRFVGGHPLAGGEAAGVDHAREDLFDGQTWYLTPTAATSGILLERLHRTITGLGARPAVIDAETHDDLMAAVSHLPHVLANLLVSHAARALGDESGLPQTGPSFRDATRVAGAHPALWEGIYLANRDALRGAIDQTVAALGEVRAALERGDGAWLSDWQRAAAADRRALMEAGLAGGPTRELRAAVPNRPGVIADLALTLGRAGINISDMALSPSPDNTTGEVALWVAAPAADRAAGLLAGLGFDVREGEGE
jgi:prephenate dehydrogenase